MRLSLHFDHVNGLWSLSWQSYTMSAPAFEYFVSEVEAMRALSMMTKLYSLPDEVSQ